MKKITCIVLALLMLLPLAACGAKEEVTLPTDVDLSGLGSLFGGEQSEPAAESDEPALPGTAPGTAPAEKDEPEPAEKEEPSAPVGANYTVSDYVLWDDDICTVKIVGFEKNEYFDDINMKVYFENKTDDKSLTFEMDNFSVCGYMMGSPWCYETANAGKNVRDALDFSKEEMDRCNITALDEVQFTLLVTEAENWLADPLVEKSFTIYPTGKTAEQIKYQPLKLTGEEPVLFENDKFRVIILGEGQFEDYMGYVLPCYIENLSDKDIMVMLDDVSVNGSMIQPFFTGTVGAGKRMVTEITFLEDKLKENEIEEIEEIEMTLVILDNTTWSNKFVEEVCIYRP